MAYVLLDLIKHLGPIMTMDSLDEKDLRASILSNSRNFLIALQSGASDEHLATSLSRIKEQERNLIRHRRTMLHPAMWKFMRNRFLNRRDEDIIDTTSGDIIAPKTVPPAP
jgi:hypothetical protein